MGKNTVFQRSVGKLGETMMETDINLPTKQGYPQIKQEMHGHKNDISKKIQNEIINFMGSKILNIIYRKKFGKYYSVILVCSLTLDKYQTIFYSALQFVNVNNLFNLFLYKVGLVKIYSVC